MMSLKRYRTRRKQAFRVPSLVLLSTAVLFLQSTATTVASENLSQVQAQRLDSGEVVVDCEDIKGTKYVVGRIVIDETAERLWPTLVNPFEFQGKICHRMKRIKILSDAPNVSLLNCRVQVVFPIPDLDYVVESRYTARRRVDFRRISGSLRDFKGFWQLKPKGDGSKTEVTYSMYLDPGFPVPDWIVRQGVRCELPSVLTGLRDRATALKNNSASPEKRNLTAAGVMVGVLP